VGLPEDAVGFLARLLREIPRVSAQNQWVGAADPAADRSDPPIFAASSVEQRIQSGLSATTRLGSLNREPNVSHVMRGLSASRSQPICATQEMGDSMVDSINPEPQPDGIDRLSGSWRAVAAAWAVVVLLVVLFAGAEAFAARHITPPRHTALAGAVIPRHNVACDGIPSGECPGFSSALAEVEHTTYPLW
jgi:hypothetical protein